MVVDTVTRGQLMGTLHSLSGGACAQALETPFRAGSTCAEMLERGSYEFIESGVAEIPTTLSSGLSEVFDLPHLWVFEVNTSLITFSSVLTSSSLRFATVPELLLFGANHKEEQLSKTILTSIEGQRRFLVLGSDSRGRTCTFLQQEEYLPKGCFIAVALA